MSRRIRVTAKRRREIDVDKLVAALLRILEAEQVAEADRQSPLPLPKRGGASDGKESAA